LVCKSTIAPFCSILKFRWTPVRDRTHRNCRKTGSTLVAAAPEVLTAVVAASTTADGPEVTTTLVAAAAVRTVVLHYAKVA
jgi:hypothetical protein